MAMDEPNSPIDALPDEVLAFIFLLNAFRRQNYDPHPTTINSLLVCKRWYHVAVNYGPIWSRLIDYDRNPIPWVRELLLRSKASLIDIGDQSIFQNAHLGHHRASPILEVLFENRPRIRTMNINIRLKPWALLCSNFLPHPAPDLEFLNIVTSSPFPDCLFPDPLFAGQAPLLRGLHLQRCLIDFTSIALTKLTELSVMDITMPSGPLFLRRPDHPLKVAPTVDTWLRILQNIPSLKYLTLSNAMTPPTRDELLVPISLPGLQFMTVGASISEGVAFLQHIIIPHDCGIRVRLNSKSSPEGDGVKLLSFLSNQLSYWPAESPNRYLQAKILTGDRIHFGNSKRVGYIWDMTEADVIKEHSQGSSDPLVWLVLSMDSLEDTVTMFSQLLALYAPTYPATTMLDLWLDVDFADSIATFPLLSTLHAFTALHTLSLLERSPLYLVPLFQIFIADYSDNHGRQPLFPALRTLRLTRTEFDTTHSSIIKYLHWRIAVGAPLVELQIIDSKVSEDVKEELWQSGGVKVVVGSLNHVPKAGSKA